MSYTVNLWTFSKKRNSTEQPNDLYIKESISAEFMDTSGILNPTLKINAKSFDPLTNVSALNYAEIAEFSRYYYISNWRYDRGLWYCELMVDVLASFKSAIGSHTTYVLRSASNYDASLPDSLYPMKANPTLSMTAYDYNPFKVLYNNGYFVIGLINGDTGSYGAVSYYVFTSAQFRQFSNTILGSFNIFSATEISDQLGKLLFNPFQYIVSCTWIPVEPNTDATVLNTVKLGWWDVSASCKRLQTNVRASGVESITIPKHPSLTASRQYLKCEPYTQYYLDFPPFGSLSLPANVLYNNASLSLVWDVDCITGAGRCCVTAGNGETIDVIHGQIGVPIQIAQMSPDISNAVQQIIPKTGINWADSLISMVGNIGSAMLANEFPMQTVGTTGGFMAGYYAITLTGIFYDVAPQEITEFGAPCCKTLTLSTLSGYVQCAHGDFAGNCTVTETEEINNYLTSGFFYE